MTATTTTCSLHVVIYIYTVNACIRTGVAGAYPGGRRWGARPPLGLSLTIQYAVNYYALFNSIQAPVHHWAPTPGRNHVSAPG